MQVWKSHKKRSDKELLHALKRNNNRHVIEEIWHRYSRLIYGLCLKILQSKPDALDALNGIFEKLIIKLPQQNIENLNAWIYTFSKNYCLEILRTQQRRQSIFNQYIEETKINIKNNTKPENHHESLTLAINKLPEKQKICLELFYYQNLSYQEISKETGIELGQIRSHLQNGRRNLKNALKHIEQ